MQTSRNKIITDLEIHQTSCREEVVKVFIENGGVAFSEAEIKKQITGEFDRTTIYRTVKILIEKDFIHQVVCDHGVLKYALTNDYKSLGNHAHFQCSECGKVICMTTVIENVNPPEGYTVQDQFLLIKGSCKKCPNSQ